MLYWTLRRCAVQAACVAHNIAPLRENLARAFCAWPVGNPHTAARPYVAAARSDRAVQMSLNIQPVLAQFAFEKLLNFDAPNGRRCESSIAAQFPVKPLESTAVICTATLKRMAQSG